MGKMKDIYVFFATLLITHPYDPLDRGPLCNGYNEMLLFICVLTTACPFYIFLYILNLPCNLSLYFCVYIPSIKKFNEEKRCYCWKCWRIPILIMLFIPFLNMIATVYLCMYACYKFQFDTRIVEDRLEDV